VTVFAIIPPEARSGAVFKAIIKLISLRYRRRMMVDPVRGVKMPGPGAFVIKNPIGPVISTVIGASLDTDNPIKRRLNPEVTP
jgi:hypothetical protein